MAGNSAHEPASCQEHQNSRRHSREDRSSRSNTEEERHSSRRSRSSSKAARRERRIRPRSESSSEDSSSPKRRRRCVQKNDLNDLKVYLKSLNAKLGHLQVNISENSKNSQRNVSKLERELRNVRGSKDFKKAGNEIQYLFNQELEGTIEDCIEFIEHENKVSTTKSLKDCLQLIRKRQKLIKIADKSEFGWLAAREYDEDEIASNSDDDKRLKKAEKAAMAKYKRNSQRNVRRLDARYSGFNSKPYSPGGFREYTQQWQRNQNFRPPYYNAPSFNPARQWCFACGNYGHWRAQCKSIQMLRQQNRSYINPSFFPNIHSKLKTPKPVVNKVSLKDMKDEYSYNFYKNIDVDEQFLIENEQHVEDGVDLCKNLSEQGETKF